MSPVSNALLVWNTLPMAEIVARLHGAAEMVSNKDLAWIV
jgi:hypothetical protein